MAGVVLVTGGNSGIGLECTRALARAGRQVFIASRNRATSEAAARAIGGQVEVLELDLASMSSVRALVHQLEQRAVPLAALVCNAGLQFNHGPRLSDDGFELTFAANHLGHFLLTNLLLERLGANAPARIVIVSSGVHDPAMRTGMPHPSISDFETLARTGSGTKGRFNGRLAYVNSKLCNLWFAYELSRRLEPSQVTVNGWEPGLVPGSGLIRDYPAPIQWVWNRVLPGLAAAINPIFAGVSTARKSGESLASLVLDPAYAGVSGKYFPSHTRWREARSSVDSYDTARARELWDASVRLSGLSRRGP
ncbi:MAG TPA: SDR family NAD(P)-dependent oxidoreductase [Myxococcota bacterium]|nr:SDR family NAD(P)-dependent oxidoreductase [Myxococcota bacterium]